MKTVNVEECTENIEGTKLVENENKHEYSSCVLYIVFFSLSLVINIGIATYFAYYKYMNCYEENVSKYDYVYQTTIY